MKTDLKYRSQQSITFADYDANMRRQMYWSSDWAPGTYEPNEVVDHFGAGWVCLVETTTTPGTIAGFTNWQQIGGVILELWQATALLPMANDVIQWSFIPGFSGQTPLLMTEAAGVFTFLTDGAPITIQMQPEVGFNYVANNSEASYIIQPNYVGTGVSTLLAILDADSSARITVLPRTAFNRGLVVANLNDTISFVADSDGTNLSNVNLSKMFLQISGPIP